MRIQSSSEGKARFHIVSQGGVREVLSEVLKQDLTLLKPLWTEGFVHFVEVLRCFPEKIIFEK